MGKNNRGRCTQYSCSGRRLTLSRVPVTSITGIGSPGGTMYPFMTLPEIGAIAASRELSVVPREKVYIAPFDCPVAYSRVTSTQYSLSRRSRTATLKSKLDTHVVQSHPFLSQPVNLCSSKGPSTFFLAEQLVSEGGG